MTRRKICASKPFWRWKIILFLFFGNINWLSCCGLTLDGCIFHYLADCQIESILRPELSLLGSLLFKVYERPRVKQFKHNLNIKGQNKRGTNESSWKAIFFAPDVPVGVTEKRLTWTRRMKNTALLWSTHSLERVKRWAFPFSPVRLLASNQLQYNVVRRYVCM